MKILLLLLLLLLQLPANASQIVVGLRSDNLISWSVWEREGSSLKHYLLLYNKTPQELDIRALLKRFKSVSTNFEVVPTSRTLFHVPLAAHTLVRLRYPKHDTGLDFMEYFENGAGIGLLPFNNARPDAVALYGLQNRFYSNEGMNNGLAGYWLGLETIYSTPTQVQALIEPTNCSFGGYQLLKICATDEDAQHQAGKLDSLTGEDSSIRRLDSTHWSAEVPVRPLRANIATPNVSVLVLLMDRVEIISCYDENRRPVSEKSIGGSIHFFPVFHLDKKHSNKKWMRACQ
ncbi:hypothetical protein [Hymenobacter sp. B1770]|uniref:hypothetical protein n=1 Tax=Hymenobacter sp. B1770 TaxID=1718788 RepID=UPI003CF7353A